MGRLTVSARPRGDKRYRGKWTVNLRPMNLLVVCLTAVLELFGCDNDSKSSSENGSEATGDGAWGR